MFCQKDVIKESDDEIGIFGIFILNKIQSSIWDKSRLFKWLTLQLFSGLPFGLWWEFVFFLVGPEASLVLLM